MDIKEPLLLIKKTPAPRPRTRKLVLGLVVGVPEPSVNMGKVLIVSHTHIHRN